MIGVILALIFLRHCAGQTITVQPMSINTTINSTVNFTCEGVGTEITFRLQFYGENETRGATDEVAINRGFSFETSNDNDARTAQLQGTAYEFNNNTSIRCRVDTNNASLSSDVAILMIQGLLDSVVDLDYTFINGSNVLLTWTAPYTLDNVPITGYYIVVNGLVNITTNDNNTNIILLATNPDPCLLNNVSVSPINDVGIGSSNNISFYYETVSPAVSAIPICDDELIYISINLSTICERQYPDSIAVIILNSDSSIIKNVTIIPQVNYQQMIATGNTSIPSCNDTFIVNVSLSNTEGTLNEMSHFVYLGPVTNIDFSVVNCSTIDITWTAPTVDDRVPILYYILRIYDAITGSLVDTVSVYNTSYQFVDNNLFIHSYTYVIAGVNEFHREGISNNNTFSNQRVPILAVEMVNYAQDQTATVSIVHYNISIAIEITSGAPVNVSITIECNETGAVYNNTTLVENDNNVTLTDSVPVPLYNNCSFIIVVSDCTGSSEPLNISFNTSPTSTISNTPSPTISNPPTADGPGRSIAIILGIVAAAVIVVIILVIVIPTSIYFLRKKCKHSPDSVKPHDLRVSRQ